MVYYRMSTYLESLILIIEKIDVVTAFQGIRTNIRLHLMSPIFTKEAHGLRERDPE